MCGAAAQSEKARVLAVSVAPGAGPSSRLRLPCLPGSGGGHGRKAWVEGGGDPGQDAAGVQQGHGGRQAGSGWLQDRAEGGRAQTPRRALPLKVRTATSPREARAASLGPRHSGPWRRDWRVRQPGSRPRRVHVVPEKGEDTADLIMTRRTEAVAPSMSF